MFLSIGAANKDLKKGKENFSDKHCHNILRLDDFNKFPFTTSETMRDYHL